MVIYLCFKIYFSIFFNMSPVYQMYKKEIFSIKIFIVKHHTEDQNFRFKAQLKIFFELWNFLFGLFQLFFDLFRFRVRFRLVWTDLHGIRLFDRQTYRQTSMTENITFPQLRWRVVTKLKMKSKAFRTSNHSNGMRTARLPTEMRGGGRAWLQPRTPPPPAMHASPLGHPPATHAPSYACPPDTHVPQTMHTPWPCAPPVTHAHGHARLPSPCSHARPPVDRQTPVKTLLPATSFVDGT